MRPWALTVATAGVCALPDGKTPQTGELKMNYKQFRTQSTQMNVLSWPETSMQGLGALVQRDKKPSTMTQVTQRASVFLIHPKFTSTSLSHKNIHKFTSEARGTKETIDYITVKKQLKTAVRNTAAFRRSETDTGHFT